MRNLITLILVLLLYSCSIFAGNIDASLTSGKKLNEGDVLSLSDTCIFKFNNPQQGINYNWMVRIDQKNGGSYEFKKQINNGATFTFCIDSALYKNATLGENFKRTILENDSCVYYTAQVYCYIENDIQGVFPLKINLLPSLPRFANVELIYDGFDDKNLIFKNDTIRFTINTSEANQLFLKRADHKRGDKYFFDLLYHYPLDITSKKNNISIPEFDFEECYTLEVSNDNGSVCSLDTVFVIDYIKDPHILEVIQEWFVATDRCFINNDIGMYYDRTTSILHIENNLLLLLECKIYDMNGIMIKSYNGNSNTIPLSELSEGIYFATLYSTKLNKYVMYKFLK